MAARLQAECPPGGICVSRSVRDHVHGRLDLAFEELGPLDLKNISRPVEAFLVTLDAASRPTLKQNIRYCRTPSGIRLAYAAVGQGPRWSDADVGSHISNTNGRMAQNSAMPV